MLSSNLFAEYPSSFNEPIVPIHEEPNHHHVLHSHSIRVFDAYFPPQQISLYHTHEKDSVMICLEGAHVTNELPGKEVVLRPPIPTGEIYYRSYAQIPFVHRIKNLSTTPFRILDIEILKEPGTPIKLNPLSRLFSIVLENDRVRVSKLQLGPAQSAGEITFAGPRLLVFLQKGQADIETELQSQTTVFDRGSLSMHEFAHTETITNRGEAAIEIVLVEMK